MSSGISQRSGPGPLVYVFSPQGAVIASHAFPADLPNKCCFAGDTLYVTTGGGHFYRWRGAGIVRDATTVWIRGGKRQVQDGPYPETKEFLAGFAIIDVPNLDSALEWAARHPAAAFASVEIRPLAGSYFAVGTSKSS